MIYAPEPDNPPKCSFVTDVIRMGVIVGDVRLIARVDVAYAASAMNAREDRSV